MWRGDEPFLDVMGMVKADMTLYIISSVLWWSLLSFSYSLLRSFRRNAALKSPVINMVMDDPLGLMAAETIAFLPL